MGYTIVGLDKAKSKFSKPSFSTVSSLGTSRTSTSRNPEAPAATETNPSSALGEDPTPSSNPLKSKGNQSLRGNLETPPIRWKQQGRLLYPDYKVISCPPNPDEEEGELTPNDADIPDSIARALLGALQERRAGNNFPPATISVARIRAAQLQRCLVTGREPAKRRIQATLDLISLGQDTTGLANLVDKVSTVSHTLRVYLESIEYRCTCADKQQ